MRQHFNDHSNLLWNILTEIEAQWGDHNDECLYMQQRVPWQDRFIIQRLTQNFILYSEKTPRNCIYSIRGHRVYFGLLMIKTMQRKKTCSVKAEECLSLMVKSVKSCRLVLVRHLKMLCCNFAGVFFLHPLTEHHCCSLQQEAQPEWSECEEVCVPEGACWQRSLLFHTEKLPTLGFVYSWII